MILAPLQSRWRWRARPQFACAPNSLRAFSGGGGEQFASRISMMRAKTRLSCVVVASDRSSQSTVWIQFFPSRRERASERASARQSSRVEETDSTFWMDFVAFHLFENCQLEMSVASSVPIHAPFCPCKSSNRLGSDVTTAADDLRLDPEFEIAKRWNDGHGAVREEGVDCDDVAKGIGHPHVPASPAAGKECSFQDQDLGSGDRGFPSEIWTEGKVGEKASQL